MFNFFNKRKKIINWQPSKQLLSLFKTKVTWDDEFIKLVVFEYKRFMYLASKTMVVPSEYVDEFWHFHILNTKDYHQFCKDYFGKYIHHTPSNKKMPREYKETYQLYYDTFNSLPDSRIWDFPKNFTLSTKKKSDSNLNSGSISDGSFDWSWNDSTNNVSDNNTSFWGGLFGGGGAGGDWDTGGDTSSCGSSCGSCGGD